MKRIFKALVFSSSIIFLLGGISKAEMTKFRTVRPDADEPGSFFSRSFHATGLDQNALQLTVGKFQKTELFKWKFFTPPSLNTIPHTTLADQGPIPTEKKSYVSLYLGGGLNNIDGGDLNRNIRDSNARYDSLNGLDQIWTNTMHWNEITWLPYLNGELIFRLFKNFSLGLGFEYILKTNPRSSAFSAYLSSELGATAEQFQSFTSTVQSEHKLTVLPIILSIYYSIPISPSVEAYVTGGVGYYMGNLKLDYFSRHNTFWLVDYFSATGNFLESSRLRASSDLTDEYEVKSNTIGFQGGVGLDFKLSPSISLIIGGNYRFVNFKNWEGDGSFTDDRTEKQEFLVGGNIEEISGTDGDAYEGKLWFYEYQDSYVNEWFDSIDFSEEQPEETSRRRNIREAEINFSGFVLRIGFKIRF